MTNENNVNKKELSLHEIWQILKQHFLFILITTIVFVSIFLLYSSFVITPDYSSNADVMIQVEQDVSGSNGTNFDLVNAFRLIDTVAELMEKEVIITNAIYRLEEKGYSNLSIEFIRDGLKVVSSSSSYFINISFIDTDPIFAQEVVDSIIDAVIEETDVADAFPVLTDKIRRTSYASDAVYNSPDIIVFTLIGMFLGIFISTGFIFSKEILSTKFKSKDEIESELNIQVLGVIPFMSIKEMNNGKK